MKGKIISICIVQYEEMIAFIINNDWLSLILQQSIAIFKK